MFKVYKNCHACYKISEVDVPGINMSYEGFKDPEKDEACFYLKEKPHYLPPPENQFAPVNPVKNEDLNVNGIYFAVSAAGLYEFLITIKKNIYNNLN